MAVGPSRILSRLSSDFPYIRVILLWLWGLKKKKEKQVEFKLMNSKTSGLEVLLLFRG